MKERPLSKAIYAASCQKMPGGVSSPVRSFPGLDVAPLIVKEGKGDSIRDVDGNSYIDYCCSWGAAVLGHAHPLVTKAACDQVAQGSSFGIATPYEEILASKIIAHMPSIEKIRFVSSGTEATMTAIRLARGFTGRSIIVKFNGQYHGHADHLLIQAGSGVSHLPQASSKGIPEDAIKHTVSLPFNDFEVFRAYLRENGEKVAAVIVEPISGNMGVVLPQEGFLQMLREETLQKGALLIFDEVITGFRVGLKGAQGLYDIKPDLTCLGKIIGGGFPAAAFGGRQDIMNHLAPLGSVYQAGTLSGNPVAMCAGIATLQELETPYFYEELEEKAKALTNSIAEAIEQYALPATLNQIGSMFTLFFGVEHVTSRDDLKEMDQELFKEFFHYMLEKGIYIPPSAYEAWFISSAHTEEHLSYTKDAIVGFLQDVASRMEAIKC